MIRPFSLFDLKPLLQIEKESFPKSSYDGATFINLHSLYRKTFLVYVSPTPDEEEKEQILGYIVFSPEGHIISIAVHSRHRRKGIGRELLRVAMNSPHVKKLWAEVRKGNQGAQAFYSRMGFQTVGVAANYYGNEDALIIQWVPPFRRQL